MFNIGSGEIALIAVVALLVLGPKGLPELARGIGKFMREFRRQTDEVRGVVEREFYKMDQEVSIQDPPLAIRPVQDNVALGSGDPHLDPHADLHAGLLAADACADRARAGRSPDSEELSARVDCCCPRSPGRRVSHEPDGAPGRAPPAAPALHRRGAGAGRRFARLRA
jgi:sec-independent protein translocase protein TatB